MKLWAKISIIAGVIVVFIVLLYAFRAKKPPPDRKYVSDDWTETYDPYDRGPYGTFMLKELMDTIGLFGNFLEVNKDIRYELKDDPELNDIYFFIGPTNYMNDSSSNFLLDFAKKGNTVFMSALNFPAIFIDSLKYSYNELQIQPVLDSFQHFKFIHPDLSAKRYESRHIYNNETSEVEWYYFNPECFNTADDDTLIPLGTNTKEQWNFLRINYGDGTIFLHATPYLFTNISMMKRSGFEYAEKILMHIPPGRVQWDRYNLTYNYYYEQGGVDGEGGGGEERKSIFQFILENPPLLWSALIILIGTLLYSLFKGKRMQRLIPAAELKENTSLNYVNTLSSLYQQEGRHNKLVALQKKTFLNFIAEKYYITTQKPDKKFFDKLSAKSHVAADQIADLFLSFERLENVQVTDDSIITLHHKIENFHKNCR